MTAALSLLVVAAIMVFVGWPLFRSRPAQADPQVEWRFPLERQKLEAYAAIKEAEFDRLMGKLSEADYATLTERYRQRALAAIALLRQSNRASERRAPRKAARHPARLSFCPSCGERLPIDANFCAACGERLPAAVA